MLTKASKILAIDPGTKELGIAVLSKLQLEHFAIKTFKHRTPPHAFLSEVSEFIDGQIAEFHPIALAIEQTFLIQRDSALLNVVATEIKQKAKQCGLEVYEYKPAQVRNKLCQASKATKNDATIVLTSRYPELRQFLKRESKWVKLYWSHVFDAVAVGLVCLDDMLSQNPTDPTPIFSVRGPGNAEF